MKKLLILTSLLVGLFAVQVTGQITGSAHDFSGYAWSAAEICLPCHTPHHADNTVADAPLWNHEVTAVAAYTLYSSSTMNAIDLGQPNGNSKLCLSCHDGTVAVDSYGGLTGTVNIATFDNGGTQPVGYAFVDTDLSDDHPISFTYDDALAGSDGELHTPSNTAAIGVGAGGTINAEMLFAGKMECASCHDVHNGAGNDNLLVLNNTGSALCLTCHSK